MLGIDGVGVGKDEGEIRYLGLSEMEVVVGLINCASECGPKDGW